MKQAIAGADVLNHDRDKAELSAAAPRVQTKTSLWQTTEVETAQTAASSDGGHVSDLLKIASDHNQLVGAQRVAAKRLLDHDGEIYPSDGCAITLSVLLQEAGISVADTYRAFDLANTLKQRGWQVVPIGQQSPGDVGSTCGPEPHHGTDHVYLTLKLVNSDEMVIADNQLDAPHFRWASGKGGKSPTTFFLRAPR